MSEGPPTSGGAPEPQQPQPVQPAVPAGWYAHPTAPGWEAYWDGAAWGPDTRPAQQAQPDPAVPAQQAQPDPAVASQDPAYQQQAQADPAQQAAPEQQAYREEPTEVRQQPATAAPAAPVPVPPAAVPASAAPAADRSGSALSPIFCVLGALVAIVGAFLPMASSDLFVDIADNTMVAAGYGLAVIAAAVLCAAIAAYCYVRGTRTWLPILLGVIVVAIAVYAGTAGLDVTPENLPDVPTGGADGGGVPPAFQDAIEKAADEDGSPSTGIFAVGIGGLLMVLGGVGIARDPK